MDYTATRIREILKSLDITPFPGNKVDSAQAATIMTWRVASEQGIEHVYTDKHVRRRVKTGALVSSGQIHNRLKLFDVKDIFALDLMPERGKGAKEREERKTQPRIKAVDKDAA